MLEISQLFWFEDILVSQKIYAIVYDCHFIAASATFTILWISVRNLNLLICFKWVYNGIWSSSSNSSLNCGMVGFQKFHLFIKFIDIIYLINIFHS
jgi:hypothetical protein